MPVKPVLRANYGLIETAGAAAVKRSLKTTPVNKQTREKPRPSGAFRFDARTPLF
jgi:hypothetical protein